MATKGRNFVMSWTPERVIKGAEAGLVRGLEMAAIAFEGEVKRVLSKPGPMKTKPTPGQRKRMEAAGETRRASLPGEPPRKRTGVLRASISHAPRKGGLIQRVGSSLGHARSLEWGSGRLKPRPYFRPTLRRMAKELGQIVMGAMKGGR